MLRIPERITALLPSWNSWSGPASVPGSAESANKAHEADKRTIVARKEVRGERKAGGHLRRRAVHLLDLIA